MMACGNRLSNPAPERAAGSPSLAAAAQRERWTVNAVDNGEGPIRSAMSGCAPCPPRGGGRDD